ncbi:MAG: hypothetical protein R3F04_12455 [Lysobacteraceae bacterium]
MGWKILLRYLFGVLCILNCRILMASPRVDFDERGSQVVGAIMVCDGDDFESLIDLKGIGLRAVQSFDVEESAASELVVEMASVAREIIASRFEEMCGENGVKSVVLGRVGTDSERGAFRLLRIDRLVENSAWLDSGYILFEFDRQGAIIDWTDLSGGFKLSEGVRRGIVIRSKRADFLGSIFGDSTPNPENLLLLDGVMQAIDVGVEDTYLALANLPLRYRKTYEWTILRLSLASKIGSGPEYHESVSMVDQSFGDRLEFRMYLADYFLLTDRYADSLRHLKAFQHEFGADSVTSMKACMVYMAKNEFSAARSSCEDSLKDEPDRKETWYLLIAIALKSQDMGRFWELVENYENRFQIKFVLRDFENSEGDAEN